MSPSELREACGDGVGAVMLVLPQRQSSNGYTIRLTPRSGPTGEVVCVNSEGNTVARFGAAAVLRWLDRNEEQTQRSS